MNKLYYIDVTENVCDPLILFEIETDLTRDEMIIFLKRKAKEYCIQNSIDHSEYENDDLNDYQPFEVEINGIHYFFMISTFLGNKYDKHLFDNLESIFDKIKLFKENVI